MLLTQTKHADETTHLQLQRNAELGASVHVLGVRKAREQSVPKVGRHVQRLHQRVQVAGRALVGQTDETRVAAGPACGAHSVVGRVAGICAPMRGGKEHAGVSMEETRRTENNEAFEKKECQSLSRAAMPLDAKWSRNKNCTLAHDSAVRAGHSRAMVLDKQVCPTMGTMNYRYCQCKLGRARIQIPAKARHRRRAGRAA